MAGGVVRDSKAMIAGMAPVLRPETYHFCHFEKPDPRLVADALASFAEDEGMSLIITDEQARGAGSATDQPMRCITLQVYSALDGIGLTAAVSTALANSGIACNMVSAYHHDHAFVPLDDASRAVSILKSLSEVAG